MEKLSLDSQLKLALNSDEDIRFLLANYPYIHINTVIELLDEDNNERIINALKNNKSNIENIIALKNFIDNRQDIDLQLSLIETILEDDESATYLTSMEYLYEAVQIKIAEALAEDYYEFIPNFFSVVRLNSCYDIIAQSKKEGAIKNLVKLDYLPHSAQISIAQNTSIFESLLESLAKNPNLCEEAIIALAQKNNSEINYYLIRNNILPNNLIYELAQDENNYSRLAQAKYLPEDIQLKILECDDSEFFKYYKLDIARNKCITLKTQEKLIQNNWALEELADNPSLFSELQNQILQKGYTAILSRNDLLEDVAIQWIQRARTSHTGFGYLVNNPTISERIQLAILEKEECLDEELLGAFLKNEALTESARNKIFEILGEDYDLNEVKTCQNTELQLKLAKHKRESVRISLAQNPHLSLEVQLILAEDNCAEVAYKLLKNEHIEGNADVQFKLSTRNDRYRWEPFIYWLCFHKDLRLSLKHIPTNYSYDFRKKIVNSREKLNDKICNVLAEDPSIRIREYLSNRDDLSEST